MSVRLRRKCLPLLMLRGHLSGVTRKPLSYSKDILLCLWGHKHPPSDGWGSYLQKPSGRTPTDRARRSGAKLGRISTRKLAETTPQAATTTPQAATWLENDTSTNILLFICTDKPKDVSQSAGWLRETHAPMAIGWLQPTLGCPFLRQYLRKEN